MSLYRTSQVSEANQTSGSVGMQRSYPMSCHIIRCQEWSLSNDRLRASPEPGWNRYRMCWIGEYIAEAQHARSARRMHQAAIVSQASRNTSSLVRLGQYLLFRPDSCAYPKPSGIPTVATNVDTPASFFQPGTDGCPSSKASRVKS